MDFDTFVRHNFGVTQEFTFPLITYNRKLELAIESIIFFKFVILKLPLSVGIKH